MDEPVDHVELRRILSVVLESGELRFSEHALDEMDADGLVEQDVRNVLRGGAWDGCDFERGSWRYRWRTPRISVVVALRSESAVVVVTAWRQR